MRAFLWVATSLALVSCTPSPANDDDTARLQEAEERLEAKLKRLEQLGDSRVRISCSELAFAKVGLEGGAGHLIVACESTEQTRDGRRIVLLVGNPFEVEYNEIVFRLDWQEGAGTGILSTLGYLGETQQEFSTPGPAAGQWKRVAVDLATTADDLRALHVSAWVPARRLPIPNAPSES
jgi:hypothetical protein